MEGESDGRESDSETPNHLQVELMATVGRSAQNLGQTAPTLC